MQHLEAVWRFEEEIGGELSLNVATFQCHNVLNVAMSQRHNVEVV